jgi:hypothetical protein
MPEFPVPHQPKDPAVWSAYLILKYAHDTAESLLQAFTDVRKARNAKGAPRDEEQDLLRAMVVFAGAGIDSMTKQLIRDALPPLIAKSSEARNRIEKLVSRHLRRGPSDGEAPLDDSLMLVNPQRLAKVLLAENTRSGITEMLVDDLTSGSLQSAAELYRILDYLGLDKKTMDVTDQALRKVFDCRNKLIHEMDIDFGQPNRNRFPRRREDMVEFAGTLLKASSNILDGVDAQLRSAK